jgi:tetratricopeptide (TPR) repeat protein
MVGTVLWIYAPAFHGGWIWDDAPYLADHLHLHDPAGWWWKTWIAPDADYYPLEATILTVQWHFWHNDTLGYHLTNVVLHILSALLVWRLLGKLGVRCAWLGGLFFAVHPMMVESVAWIVELKNMLSLPLLLLAMCAYLSYDEKKQVRDYVLALLMFLAAMLCKAAVMMFPAVILLHAKWKRGRIAWKDVKASLPFFALSLMLAIPSALLQHQNNEQVVVNVGLFARLSAAGWEVMFYLYRFLIPIHLLPVYPSGLSPGFSWMELWPWLLIAAFFAVLRLSPAAWRRHAWLGLGFFLLNLIPVMGFVVANATTMAWSMDHLAYISIIGLIGLFVAGWGWLEGKLPISARPFTAGILAILVALLAGESHSYAKFFQSEEILWNYTLQGNPNSPLVRTNLGVLLASEGRIVEAEKQFREALHLDPHWVEAGNNLGLVLQQMGRTQEALTTYEKVLAIKPDYAQARGNFGSALAADGQVPAALEQFKEAIHLRSNDPKLHYNLANTLADANRLPEAVEHYHDALELDPDFVQAHFSLANTLVRMGHLPEAVEQYKRAVTIDPRYADAHANLGNVLLELDQVPQAIEQYENAVRLNPRDVDTRNTLGLVLLKIGQPTEAVEQFKAILKIDPQNDRAKKNLARIEAAQPSSP